MILGVTCTSNNFLIHRVANGGPTACDIHVRDVVNTSFTGTINVIIYYVLYS